MELEPGKQAFVKAVMAPLGDDPARQELLESVVANASVLPSPDTNSDRLAVARMEATSKRFPQTRRIGASIVIAVFIVTTWLTLLSPQTLRSIDAIWAANQIDRLVGSMCCGSPGVPSIPRPRPDDDHFENDRACQHLLNGLPMESRMLLVGAPQKEERTERWKPVWDAHPDEAAHYFAYLLACRYDDAAWPKNSVAIGERLDPGNGMFRLMDATGRMKKAIGEAPAPRATRAAKLAARTGGKPPPVTRRRTGKPPRVVLDQKAFTEAWDELERSLSMPRFDDYTSRLKALRQEASLPTRDFAEVCIWQILTYSQPEDYSSGWIDFHSLAEGIALAAVDAAKTGDRERLEEIEKLLLRTSRRLCESSSGLIPALISRRVAKQGAEGIAKAWLELGEASKAAPLENLASLLDLKRHPAPAAPPDALTENRSSNLASLAILGSSNRSPASPPITESDLRGGRLAEYSMYERLMLHAIAALLALSILFMFLAPLRGRKKSGALPARLAGLLDWRDQLWIAILGVVLPFTIYIVCTRVESMAPREFGLSRQRFLLWSVQALALVVSIVAAVLQATRWRLGRRGAILALGWIGPDPGRFFLLFALGAMPLASLLPPLLGRFSIDEKWILASVCLMTSLPLIWLGILAAGLFVGGPARDLHRRVLVSGARPFLALALIVTAVAIPAVYQEEKHWVAHIQLESLKDGDTVLVTRHEKEYATWLATEALRHLKALE